LKFSTSRCKVLPRSADHHRWACLALPIKTNGHHQAHLMPPMKTHGHCQLYLAHPMSPSILHQPHRVLAQNYKGVDIAGAEKMRALLPIPLQASIRKLTSKWMAQVPAHGGQPGNAVQQGRLLQGELHCCMQKVLAYGGYIPLIKSLHICSCTHWRHLTCLLQYPTAITTQLGLALPSLLSLYFFTYPFPFAALPLIHFPFYLQLYPTLHHFPFPSLFKFSLLDLEAPGGLS